MRQLAAAMLIATTTTVGVACEPPSPAPECIAAMYRIWTKDQPWAARVIMRESHGLAAAQNRRSSAAGCFQLTQIHADLFAGVGGWPARYDATANVTAAWRLYLGSGRTPWK